MSASRDLTFSSPLGGWDFDKQFEKELQSPSWSFGLHTASSLGSLSCVLNLIQRGVDVNAINRKRWTPLMYASYYDRETIASHLIRAKADVNRKNGKGQTSLMLAAMCGQLALVELLTKNGSSVDASDDNGITALFYAVRYGHDAIVHLLLDSGSNPNCFEKNTGLTPLILVAAEGRESLLHAFLKKGANVNNRNANGQTARSVAVAGRHSRIVSAIDGHVSRTNSVSSLFAGIATTNPRSTPPFVSSPESIPSSNTSSTDLELFLEKIGLSKYRSVLEEQDVDFDVFLTMTDSDLREVGIKLLGPRRKMLNAIERWHNENKNPK